MEYYVYEWIRLDTNEPFYIGKGKGRRWCVLKRENDRFNKIVNKIPVAVNILESNLCEKEAFEYEIYYINEYRNIGFDLVNICDGGENPPTLYGKENGNYGNHWSKDKKLYISNLKKGKQLREENPNSKKVICLETEKVFNCILDAQDYYNIKTYSSLTIALNQKDGDRTAGGYHWMFLDELNGKDCFEVLIENIVTSNTRKKYYVDIVDKKIYIKSSLIKKLGIDVRAFNKNKYDYDRYLKIDDYYCRFIQ